jgi:hypothetical protein
MTGVLTGSAEVASIQVKDPNLEAHLQSPDFFDAERFPQLSFRARDVGRAGDDLAMSGELTLKGHTEPVEIKGHVTDPAQDPYGGERFGLKLEATIDRRDDRRRRLKVTSNRRCDSRSRPAGAHPSYCKWLASSAAATRARACSRSTSSPFKPNWWRSPPGRRLRSPQASLTSSESSPKV